MAVLNDAPGKKIGKTPAKSQSYTLPPGYVPPAPTPRDQYGVTQDGVTTWMDGTVTGAGGGARGGGGGAPAPVTPAPALSFDDYVAKDFGYNTAQNEGKRRLQEFDAATLLQRQQTEAEQAMRRATLQQVLQEMGGDIANDFANRGLLRSGLYMQGQGAVDRASVQGNQGIEQMLSDLIAQRGQGRVDLEAQNRATLNDVLNQLSSQFNSGLAIA